MNTFLVINLISNVAIVHSWTSAAARLRCHPSRQRTAATIAAAVENAAADVWDPTGRRKREWAAGYDSQLEETSYEIAADDIVGKIPVGLVGTLFRNGPGRLFRGGQAYSHAFDGDGMVCRLTMRADGSAHFANAFVRTEGFVAEEAAGKVLRRNTFGTQRRGGALANVGDVFQKNVANTNVIWWGGKLLALWEAGQPYRLDPATLATLDVDLLGGALIPGMPFATPSPVLNGVLRGLVGTPLCAHPKVAPPHPHAASPYPSATTVRLPLYRARQNLLPIY